MKKPLFTGAGVAIVTPFHADGSINYEALGTLIDFQIENRTDAIIICGTTGEAATMSDAEHKAAIEYAVKRVAGRVPVIAGTGSNDTAYSISLSQYAEQVGADGLLLVTPYYNKCTQKGLVLHFSAIADSTSLPCILYNVPSRTGTCIGIDAYKELSKHPKIAAAKEASGDISAIAKIAAACGDDLVLYSGNDDQIIPILSLGGKGVISVLSNIMPAETHEICELYLTGHTKEAAELQLRLLDLTNALFLEVNPIPVKTALNWMGFQAGVFRLPLCEMSEKNAAILRKAMIEAGLKVH